jgi:hypothetical protein
VIRFVATLLLVACSTPADTDGDASLAEDCPDALVDDIVACVEDWLGDPENTDSAEDLVVACSDAEPLADAWDAFCATADPRPSLCDASYEQAWTTVRDGCASEASTALGL